MHTDNRAPDVNLVRRSLLDDALDVVLPRGGPVRVVRAQVPRNLGGDPVGDSAGGGFRVYVLTNQHSVHGRVATSPVLFHVSMLFIANGRLTWAHDDPYPGSRSSLVERLQRTEAVKVHHTARRILEAHVGVDADRIEPSSFRFLEDVGPQGWHW